MNDMTAQFLTGKIDEFLRILRQAVEHNERAAIALEALASQKYEDEADDEDEEHVASLNLSKLNIDANG